MLQDSGLQDLALRRRMPPGLASQGSGLQDSGLQDLALRRRMPPGLARLPEHWPAPGGAASAGRTRTPVRRADLRGWPGRANRRGWPPDLPDLPV